MENLRYATENVLQTVRKFSKVAWYRITTDQYILDEKT